MRSSNLHMGVIKKHDFGVTSEMVKTLLMGCNKWWKREVKFWKKHVSCLAADMVIVFCRGLKVEEFFLGALKGMLKFCEETRLKILKSHVMVTFKGRFKGETGDKWNMLTRLGATSEKFTDSVRIPMSPVMGTNSWTGRMRSKDQMK